MSWILCKLLSHYRFSRLHLKWIFSWHQYLSSLDWCYSGRLLKQAIALCWALLWSLLIVGIFTIDFYWLMSKVHQFKLHFQTSNWKNQCIYLWVAGSAHLLYIFWSLARIPQNTHLVRSSWRIFLSIYLPFRKLEEILWSYHSIDCGFLSNILCWCRKNEEIMSVLMDL